MDPPTQAELAVFVQGLGAPEILHHLPVPDGQTYGFEGMSGSIDIMN